MWQGSARPECGVRTLGQGQRPARCHFLPWAMSVGSHLPHRLCADRVPSGRAAEEICMNTPREESANLHDPAPAGPGVTARSRSALPVALPHGPTVPGTTRRPAPRGKGCLRAWCQRPGPKGPGLSPTSPAQLGGLLAARPQCHQISKEGKAGVIITPSQFHQRRGLGTGKTRLCGSMEWEERPHGRCRAVPVVTRMTRVPGLCHTTDGTHRVLGPGLLVSMQLPRLLIHILNTQDHRH